MNKEDKKYIESLVGEINRKMPDYDGDGYPDLFDCDPFDPTKDGLIGEAWSRMTAAAQTARRRIYRPAAVGGREAVGEVYRRAYGAGAAARAAAETRISRAREFVRAPPTERAKRIEVGKEAFVRARKPKQISDVSRRIHEETARVAKVARGFEKQVDPYARDVERALGFHKEIIPEPVRWTGEQAKQLGYGIAFHAPAAAVEMAGMVPGGVETIARKPSILPAAAALGTFEMGRGVWHGMTTAPGRTMGELIGMGAISKGVPKVPVPARVTRALPTRAPTPIELTLGKKIKFEAALEVAQKLAKAEPLVKKPLDFGEIKTLPKGAGKAVETWIKAHPEQKSVIFGSGAARTQMRVSRKPGDLDVFMKDPATAAKQIHAVLVKKLGAKNVSIGTATMRNKPGGHTVWTKVKGEWNHAVDIHSRTEMSGRMTLGFETQPPIKIGGIEYTRIGEQLTRKAASILQVKGRTIGPPEKRAPKDIGDYMDISAELIESRTKAAESSWLLSEYKMGKVEHLRKMRHEYEIHSYLAPEVTPAIRGYYGLPRAVRAPGYIVAAIGVGAKYPPPTKYPVVDKYPVAKYPGAVEYAPAVPTVRPYPTPKEYPGPKVVEYPKVTKYPKVVDYPKVVEYPKVTKYPKVVDYPKVVEYPKVTKYPKVVDYPKVVEYPKVTEFFGDEYFKMTDHKKYIAKAKKDKKKVKPPKAKPEMAVGWKQRHKLITLESLLGYKL